MAEFSVRQSIKKEKQDISSRVTSQDRGIQRTIDNEASLVDNKVGMRLRICTTFITYQVGEEFFEIIRAFVVSIHKICSSDVENIIY